MDKKTARIRRATRARAKIRELAAHRLVVNRTPRHIYAQLIAPCGSEVLAAASTVEKDLAKDLKSTGNAEAATVVGKSNRRAPRLRKALKQWLSIAVVSNTTVALKH